MLNLISERAAQPAASGALLRLATEQGSVASSGRATYRGPERRASGQTARQIYQIFDVFDYGLLLLGPCGQVLHVNQAARAELDDDHPLQLVGRELRARRLQDIGPLNDALAAAARGLLKFVTLGESGHQISMTVRPLPSEDGGAPAATLLLLSKRKLCEQLSVQWFARSHSLTPTETRVLEALCDGRDPREIAADHGVGLATVRTQIGSIRSKTGAESIRDLVRRIAVLPPMVSALRMAA